MKLKDFEDYLKANLEPEIAQYLAQTAGGMKEDVQPDLAEGMNEFPSPTLQSWEHPYMRETDERGRALKVREPLLHPDGSRRGNFGSAILFKAPSGEAAIGAARALLGDGGYSDVRVKETAAGGNYLLGLAVQYNPDHPEDVDAAMGRLLGFSRAVWGAISTYAPLDTGKIRSYEGASTFGDTKETSLARWAASKGV